MAKFPVLVNLISVLLLQLSSANTDILPLETYIVHVDEPDTHLMSEQSQYLESWYNSFLPATTASSVGTPRMVYSYNNVFFGFAAKLTPDEVKAMQEKKGFISAKPQQKLHLHTTHTPNFLGLHQNTGLWKHSNYGRGIIIGVLDTGIFPDHPSFNDEGMPPPPPKWKGKCEFNFTICNNKLIGARHFKNGGGTPLDEHGHGTHAASVAAGSFVGGANIYGNANGTASGVAPLAHLAVYKVCTANECFESDILAAMDAAIEEGVNIISISFGGLSRAFHEDGVALGAFSAAARGIFVSCSAGNRDPSHLTLSNEAPWILTVGASTIDRNLRATVVLGNGVRLNGESAFQPEGLNLEQQPLVYPGRNESDFTAHFCTPESLNNTGVRGKVVLCYIDSGTTKVEQGRRVRDAGGAAMIILNMEHEGSTTSADNHVIPASNLDYQDGKKILAYMNSSSAPTATILFKGTIIGDKTAPTVAEFSSRGPSFVGRGILKPDIIGPGVNILAAWPNSVEKNYADKRNTFNLMSGTSVACPHLSGVAALIKSAHPDWSPAAIKSAIITTADVVNHENRPIMDGENRPADKFATGGGHVNPSRASDPGLVYDVEPQDYVPYLCGLNYTSREVSKILLSRVNCSAITVIPEGQLNYPSLVIRLAQVNQRLTRTVTNVGEAKASYSVESVAPQGFDIIVKPGRLDFSELKQKLTYEVTFRRSGDPLSNTTFSISQGYILWKSAKHSVRSPVAAVEI